MTYDTPFLKRMKNYLHVNAFAPDALKDLLSAPQNRQLRDNLKSDFKELLDKKYLHKKQFEELTGHEFESEADYFLFLNEVYQYLFEKGPWPNQT